MVQCSKCGFNNKYSGMCKQCGAVNVPPVSINKRISEMCTKQKVLACVIACFHTVWLLTTILGICVYAVSVILACTMSSSEYADLLTKAPILIADLPNMAQISPILMITITALISLIGIAVAILLYVISLNAVIKFGKAITILQVYWIASVIFSIYAMGAIDYTLFMIIFFVAVIISLLLILYRKYEFSDN